MPVIKISEIKPMRTDITTNEKGKTIKTTIKYCSKEEAGYYINGRKIKDEVVQQALKAASFNGPMQF
jgi:hypothetical protein